MRALRKLVLGETWTLPLGVAVTLAVALVLHSLAGESEWWRLGGGFLVLVLVLGTLVASLAPARRRR